MSMGCGDTVRHVLCDILTTGARPQQLYGGGRGGGRGHVPPPGRPHGGGGGAE